MGLESLLLGAHAEGVRNVLAVTGDPPEVGDYPGCAGRLRGRLDRAHAADLAPERGEDYNGKAIDAPTSFFTGVAVNPTADDLELEAERFEQKVDAGARFAMTQILFDLPTSTASSSGSAAARRSRSSSGIFPSAATASRSGCTTRCRGSSSPRTCSGAPRRGRRRRRRRHRARAQLWRVAEKAAGVYVVAPFRQPLAALDLLA